MEHPYSISIYIVRCDDKSAAAIHMGHPMKQRKATAGVSNLGGLDCSARRSRRVRLGII
jgi:hypothetical protein